MVIPHRAPILCVDSVLHVDDEVAITERRVRAGPDVSDGDLWEEGLMEGLAQTAAVLSAAAEERSGLRSLRGLLVGIRRFHVARRARVGETIRFRVKLVRRITPVTLVHGEATCGDEVLASGELKFFVELAP